MARSTYIYLVQCERFQVVYAAFTVKHECAKWLRQTNIRLGALQVRRVPDGSLPELSSSRLAIQWAEDFLKANP